MCIYNVIIFLLGHILTGNINRPMPQFTFYRETWLFHVLSMPKNQVLPIQVAVLSRTRKPGKPRGKSLERVLHPMLQQRSWRLKANSCHLIIFFCRFNVAIHSCHLIIFFCRFTAMLPFIIGLYKTCKIPNKRAREANKRCYFDGKPVL